MTSILACAIHLVKATAVTLVISWLCFIINHTDLTLSLYDLVFFNLYVVIYTTHISNSLLCDAVGQEIENKRLNR